MLAHHGRTGTPIWWTEWGVTPTHFNEVSDAVFAGAFLLRVGQAWPTDAQWETLRESDRLVKLDLVLPMPSMSQLTLVSVE